MWNLSPRSLQLRAFFVGTSSMNAGNAFLKLFPQVLNEIEVGALAGRLHYDHTVGGEPIKKKDTDGLRHFTLYDVVERVLRVIILLKRVTKPWGGTSEREHYILQDMFVHKAIHVASDAVKRSEPIAAEQDHTITLPPLCFTVGVWYFELNLVPTGRFA
uniref:Uncharacterized protein n=1 Tax=Caenorhabditis japonica TaxID=281687 RepID=A0A8R1ECB0_CAEJA